MASEGKTSSGLEQFKGKGYAMWKDKLLTHINTQDQFYKRKQLEKGLPEVRVLMADFLHGSPQKPLPVPDESELTKEERVTYRWGVMDWERAKGDMQNLLNQVLPNFFLSTLPDLVSQMEPREVMKALEKDYGQGDAAGLIELTRAWSKLAKSQWRDLRTLFSKLKKSRNEINRKTQALLGQDMVTETWLCVEVLSQLPSEFWASSVTIKKGDFTVEKVEGALRRIFGEKSKKDIAMLSEKGSSIPINNVAQGQKRKQVDCFYCLETGHFKVDCPVMARDRDPKREGGPLYRTDVQTAPGAKKARKGKQTKKTALNTMKAIVEDGKGRLNEKGKTLLEECEEDQVMDDISSLDPDFHEGFNDGGNSADTPSQSIFDLDDLEEKEQEEL